MDYREDPDPFCRSCNEWRKGYEDLQKKLQDARTAASAARASERERCMAALCEGCKAGYPTRWYPSGHWHEFKIPGREEFLERFHCRADAIRKMEEAE